MTVNLKDAPLPFSQTLLLPAFHQKLLAHELTLARPAHDSQKLTRSLNSAQVDLNPHQIDAALFAFRSPLSRGAILADEVGLGKTIEADLDHAKREVVRYLDIPADATLDAARAHGGSP